MARSPYGSLYERLVANTAEPVSDQGCWPWTAKRDRWGYGRVNVYVYVDGKVVILQAHIAMWVWLEAAPQTVEEFYTAYLMVTASGLELDHLCEEPGCCNPDHLDLVTGSENCRRRDQRAALRVSSCDWMFSRC